MSWASIDWYLAHLHSCSKQALNCLGERKKENKRRSGIKKNQQEWKPNTRGYNFTFCVVEHASISLNKLLETENIFLVNNILNQSMQRNPIGPFPWGFNMAFTFEVSADVLPTCFEVFEKLANRNHDQIQFKLVLFSLINFIAPLSWLAERSETPKDAVANYLSRHALGTLVK